MVSQQLLLLRASPFQPFRLALPFVSGANTDCCREGHGSASGLFVLQGGEDGEQDEDWIEELVGRLRAEFPRHAITLSVGERDGEAYRRWRDAGADRYLLRHETRNEAHYALLHPREMDGARRRECLRTLKALGYQTGAGMMVGSPGQTWDCLLDDIAFWKNWNRR